jgi:hypothetical protein
MNFPPKSQAHQPEHWQTEAGTSPVAVLDIPGLLSRARVFGIDATLIVDVPDAPQDRDAWLELTVEIDGQRQWNRRIAAHSPSQTDGLGYRQRVRLAVAQGIRIGAVAAVKGTQMKTLWTKAQEGV